MPTVTESSIISKPASEVWTVLADLSRYDEWLTIHAGFPDGTPTSLEPGAEFRQKVKIMGMPGEVSWTVSELDHENKIEMSGKGPMGIVLRSAFALEESNGSTTVVMESEFSGGTLNGPMGDTLAKHSAKSAKESLEKLGHLI